MMIPAPRTALDCGKWIPKAHFHPASASKALWHAPYGRNSMREIGKSWNAQSAVVKLSIPLSAVVGFASAIFILLPTEASAQFNIDGMIRGAIGRGNYGYGSRSHHSSHSSSHHESSNRDDDSPSDNKTGKGIRSSNGSNDSNDQDNKHSGGIGPGDSRSAASDSSSPKGRPSGGPPVESPAGSSGASSGGPSKSPDDAPAFAPSR
jgi:hypothetical protein